MSGDPARAARVLIDIAETNDPPKRLLLGSDAVGLARQFAADLATETETWAEVTLSTNYPTPA